MYRVGLKKWHTFGIWVSCLVRWAIFVTCVDCVSASSARRSSVSMTSRWTCVSDVVTRAPRSTTWPATTTTPLHTTTTTTTRTTATITTTTEIYHVHYIQPLVERTRDTVLTRCTLSARWRTVQLADIPPPSPQCTLSAPYSAYFLQVSSSRCSSTLFLSRPCFIIPIFLFSLHFYVYHSLSVLLSAFWPFSLFFISIYQSRGLRSRSFNKTGLRPTLILVLVLYCWSWS